jgi:hypothetical protein
MVFLGKDICHLRMFSDDEVIKIREDWGAAEQSMRDFINSIPDKKASVAAYYSILTGANYKYLLPGHKYREWYDNQK